MVHAPVLKEVCEFCEDVTQCLVACVPVGVALVLHGFEFFHDTAEQVDLITVVGQYTFEELEIFVSGLGDLGDDALVDLCGVFFSFDPFLPFGADVEDHYCAEDYQ